jgi:DNA repair photolyase
MSKKGDVQKVSKRPEQHQLEFAQPSQQPPDQADLIAPAKDDVAIRQKACKTILNRTTISDYSLNCYTGCTHGCVYCYARFMQRFSPHPEPWGKFVDVKINAVEVLMRQLRRATPGEVFVSSACDGWQHIEAEWQLTRRCCELLLEHGFSVNVLTKSQLVLRDLDVFSGSDAGIGVTVTTLDERLRRLWEPNSSSTEERFRIIKRARRERLKTTIMFGPLLPFLSDSQSSIDSMFGRAAELDVDVIWVDALNPRPKVWPSVASLLHQRFPDMLDPYKQVLFDRKMRAAYLEGLRQRVTPAVRRFSLNGRVNICF